MRRIVDAIERASFANGVSEALSVNSGLSFRRAFSIVPASTWRLACARKYHDWWARNSSRVSSILSLCHSSVASLCPSFTSYFDLFGMKSEVYKEHTMEPDFPHPYFCLWSLNTSFAVAIVWLFDATCRHHAYLSALFEFEFCSQWRSDKISRRSPLNVITFDGSVSYLMIYGYLEGWIYLPLELYLLKFMTLSNCFVADAGSDMFFRRSIDRNISCL